MNEQNKKYMKEDCNVSPKKVRHKSTTLRKKKKVKQNTTEQSVFPAKSKKALNP